MQIRKCERWLPVLVLTVAAGLTGCAEPSTAPRDNPNTIRADQQCYVIDGKIYCTGVSSVTGYTLGHR